MKPHDRARRQASPRLRTVSRAHHGAISMLPITLRQKIVAKAPSTIAAAFITPSITLKQASPVMATRTGSMPPTEERAPEASGGECGAGETGAEGGDGHAACAIAPPPAAANWPETKTAPFVSQRTARWTTG
jgi:hypothetical protein